MVSITADSNIWVSAFNFGGKPRHLIDMADRGLIRIDISDFIVEEVLRVLRLKFEWSPGSLEEIRSQMYAIGRKTEPEMAFQTIREDPSDNRILECAVAGRSDFIVTGDSHLLRLGEFSGVKIVRPSEFLDIHTQA